MPKFITDDVRHAMYFAATLVKHQGMTARAAAAEAIRVTGIDRLPDSLTNAMRREGMIGPLDGRTQRRKDYPPEALADWRTLRECRVPQLLAARCLITKYNLGRTENSVMQYMAEHIGAHFESPFPWVRRELEQAKKEGN